MSWASHLTSLYVGFLSCCIQPTSHKISWEIHVSVPCSDNSRWKFALNAMAEKTNPPPPKQTTKHEMWNSACLRYSQAATNSAHFGRQCTSKHDRAKVRVPKDLGFSLSLRNEETVTLTPCFLMCWKPFPDGPRRSRAFLCIGLYPMCTEDTAKMSICFGGSRTGSTACFCIWESTFMVCYSSLGGGSSFLLSLSGWVYGSLQRQLWISAVVTLWALWPLHQLW